MTGTMMCAHSWGVEGCCASVETAAHDEAEQLRQRVAERDATIARLHRLLALMYQRYETAMPIPDAIDETSILGIEFRLTEAEDDEIVAALAEQPSPPDPRDATIARITMVLEILADDATWAPNAPEVIPVRVRDIARAALAEPPS